MSQENSLSSTETSSESEEEIFHIYDQFGRIIKEAESKKVKEKNRRPVSGEKRGPRGWHKF